jgi:hypothetical protein
MKDKKLEKPRRTSFITFMKGISLYYTINLKGLDVPRIRYLDRYTPTVYTYTCKGFSLNKEG